MWKKRTAFDGVIFDKYIYHVVILYSLSLLNTRHITLISLLKDHRDVLLKNCDRQCLTDVLVVSKLLNMPVLPACYLNMMHTRCAHCDTVMQFKRVKIYYN